jgi:hypothetical protein
MTKDKKQLMKWIVMSTFVYNNLLNLFAKSNSDIVLLFLFKTYVGIDTKIATKKKHFFENKPPFTIIKAIRAWICSLMIV